MRTPRWSRLKAARSVSMAIVSVVDPDETEGRRLYRLRADKLAHVQMSIARRKVSMKGKNETHEHDWFRPSFLSYDCCRICGIVRRTDDKNKPCKGPTKIVLKDRDNG